MVPCCNQNFLLICFKPAVCSIWHDLKWPSLFFLLGHCLALVSLSHYAQNRVNKLNLQDFLKYCYYYLFQWKDCTILKIQQKGRQWQDRFTAPFSVESSVQSKWFTCLLALRGAVSWVIIHLNGQCSTMKMIVQLQIHSNLLVRISDW